MSVVAHLTGGLGTVSTHVDVRFAETEELVYTTLPRQMSIPSRDILVRLVHTLEGVPFAQPGIYFVQLCCENTCIADVRLQLHERSGGPTGESNGQLE